MTEKQVVWNFVYNFLNAQGLYTNKESIIFGYQSGVPLPSDSNFVILSRLDSRISYTSTSEYTPKGTTSNVTISNLIDVLYQIDFYGKLANDASDRFITYLRSSFGCDDIAAIMANYGIIGADNPIQLTAPIDRDYYTERYMIKFTIQRNESFTKSVDYTTLPDQHVNFNIL